MLAYPKISIVTPNLNQGQFLEAAIQSVLDQDYAEIEYIVMDGGSSDESLGIIKKYSPRLHYWESAPDRGQSDAINRGFMRASGDIVGWLNSDDRLTSGSLNAVAEAYQACSDKENFWLIGAGKVMNEWGRTLILKKPKSKMSFEDIWMWQRNWFVQPSSFWSKQLNEKAGPLDELIHYAMDYDLWLRMISLASPNMTDKILSVCIRHQDSKSCSDRKKMFRSVRSVMRDYCPENSQGKLLANDLELWLQYVWSGIIGNIKRFSMAKKIECFLSR